MSPKRLNLDKLKLTFIDARDVPHVRKRCEPCEDWEKIFSMILVGKALHVKASERKAVTVRMALRRLQKQGKFSRFKHVQRQGDSYIINPKGEN